MCHSHVYAHMYIAVDLSSIAIDVFLCTVFAICVHSYMYEDELYEVYISCTHMCT